METVLDNEVRQTFEETDHRLQGHQCLFPGQAGERNQTLVQTTTSMIEAELGKGARTWLAVSDMAEENYHVIILKGFILVHGMGGVTLLCGKRDWKFTELSAQDELNRVTN